METSLTKRSADANLGTPHHQNSNRTRFEPSRRSLFLFCNQCRQSTVGSTVISRCFSPPEEPVFLHFLEEEENDEEEGRTCAIRFAGFGCYRSIKTSACVRRVCLYDSFLSAGQEITDFGTLVVVKASHRRHRECSPSPRCHSAGMIIAPLEAGQSNAHECHPLVVSCG